MDDSVDFALETFLKSKVQILAVTDEFGGTAGIVTMEDAIETLLGEEIVDELDEHEDMRELARRATEQASRRRMIKNLIFYPSTIILLSINIHSILGMSQRVNKM